MRKQLLVVDDDPLFVDFVREILAIEDIDVVSATNGRDALTILKTTQPSFILSDLEMPEMDGIELHAHLSGETQFKDIPFFFMTGSSQQILTEYTKEHGIPLFYKSSLVSELIRLLDILK